MITDISTKDRKRIARRMGKMTKKPTVQVKDSNISDALSDLEMYARLYYSLSDFRRRFRRTCRFNRGDQWSDPVINENGETVREDEYILEQGKIPLVQNIIRPTAKSLGGLFRSEKGKSIVISRKPNSGNLEKMLTNALQYALNINEAKEIDSRMFDLFLLSGLPIQRIKYDFMDELERWDVIIENIDPNYFIFNTDIKDVRGNDLRVAGLLHDITLDELFVSFAKNEADKKVLHEIYSSVSNRDILITKGLGERNRTDLSFYTSNDPTKCRVIEIWEKKAVTVIECWDTLNGKQYVWGGSLNDIIAENEARIADYQRLGYPEEEWALIKYDTQIVFKWFYRFLTPWGHTLREGETPYAHNSHPFVFYPYPLINGEVWGPIEDIIDQQKYINRLVTLWDFIIGTSAKNTVIFDKNSLDGKSIEEVGADYRQVGGAIALDLGSGHKPPIELGGKMVNFGVTELISMQLKWLQDISGVQPAMQGQAPSSGTPSARYAQEAQYATNNSRDLLESYGAFRKRRDYKVLKLIMQFYREKRYLAISGGTTNDDTSMYDPEKIEGLGSEFDLVVGQSTDSPTYKNWQDDMMMDLVKGNLLELKMALPHLNAPWAQSLLEDIQNQEEQMQAGQVTPNQAVTNLAQNFNTQQNVNPEQLKQAEQLIKAGVN